jgi:hypothetical protein
MKRCLFSIALLACVEVLISPLTAIAKNKPAEACKVYFMAVERDTQTSKLNMVGLNKPQADWWKKHGARDAPSVCLVNGNATGERVTAESVDEKYIEGVVQSAPLYSVAWGEEKEFVPDSDGGHYAYDARGILSVWSPSANKGEGDFIAVGPIHNTNRTILSSSSLSLLKDALVEIRKRAE